MVRLGIVGLGTIAHDYIDLICQGNVSDVALTALCSRDEAKLTQASHQLDLMQWICGTHGSVAVENDTDVSLTYLNEDERSFAKTSPSPFTLVPYTKKSVCFEQESNKVQQASTIQNFIDAIEKSAPLLCPLEEGIRSLQIIHGAYVSQEVQREVAVPVSETMFQEFLAKQELAE